MWPWGHLAVGYLAYSGVRRTRTDRPPTGLEVVVLAVGTQFPDIVDKPLAWWFGVLPTGRSLAHSLVTASLVLAVAYWVCRRTKTRNLWAAFAVGYLSHPFADVLQPVLAGQYGQASFLLWPALSLPQSHPVALSTGGVSSDFVLELPFVVAATVLWLADGAPGVSQFLPSTVSLHRKQ
ncbi:metal-dependent hydrolase [Haladaptatus sp. AB643]|uniref:metal-dependent hydrolase n=1 Tax=Haladaptatus sp. AB643 TaxID=2934174 RepID=UPI00209C345C|nr:metal-dependent hydrolase [Haladaptatus sp. AB643]MCO8246704.1 metal-dependent hydrolase [Haladaptatus sp. AB643]